MAHTRLVFAIVAVTAMALGHSTGTAWAETDDAANDIAEAVGTGVVGDTLVGFHSSGDNLDEASANLIAACEEAGGVQCTVDEVTNDDLCIVSVTDDVSDVVAGGAGVTVEAAREDALKRAIDNNTPLGPEAMIVIADCP